MKENHKGHTFRNIEDTLEVTEEPCRNKIQSAKNILPKLRDRLKKLSDQRAKSKDEISGVRRRLQENAKQIKDLVDTILKERLGDLDISDKCLDEDFENQSNIIARLMSNYQNFIEGFVDEEKRPFERLALRNEILQSEITEPELPCIENPQYQPGIISKDSVMKLLGKLKMPLKSRYENPIQQVSKQHTESGGYSSNGSPVKCLEFKVPSTDLRHISCLSVDKVWVGDKKGKIMLMDKTGNKLDEFKTDASSLFGYHTVTEDGDLLYIDKSNKSIKKYTPDRKTTTVITTTGGWCPCSVYSSHRTGDILVGMYLRHLKVVRYNQEGRELWQSQYDAQGQPLYKFPGYITENVNGDICTIDNGDDQAVVVVDGNGNYRFSYRGPQDGSHFNLYGICTDVHGRILVVVNSNSVHMIDQNGEFISVLLTGGLTGGHGIFCDYGLCTDSGNNIWLCGRNRVKMYQYLD
jgi:hypothetical protein